MFIIVIFDHTKYERKIAFTFIAVVWLYIFYEHNSNRFLIGISHWITIEQVPFAYIILLLLFIVKIFHNLKTCINYIVKMVHYFKKIE